VAAPLNTGFFQMPSAPRTRVPILLALMDPSGALTATADSLPERIMTPSMTAWPPALGLDPSAVTPGFS
jgi:hypothetical protein